MRKAAVYGLAGWVVLVSAMFLFPEVKHHAYVLVALVTNYGEMQEIEREALGLTEFQKMAAAPRVLEKVWELGGKNFWRLSALFGVILVVGVVVDAWSRSHEFPFGKPFKSPRVR